jgi:hypothetical protein
MCADSFVKEVLQEKVKTISIVNGYVKGEKKTGRRERTYERGGERRWGNEREEGRGIERRGEGDRLISVVENHFQ